MNVRRQATATAMRAGGREAKVGKWQEYAAGARAKVYLVVVVEA